MSWPPVHGCALPLPRPKKPGVKQHGPKPCQVFLHCQQDPLLAWIHRVAGFEGVADWLLERIESNRLNIHERMESMRLLRSCQGRMEAVEKSTRQAIEVALKPETRKQREAHADAWEQKKGQLIARDERRRAGEQEHRRRLERAVRKPAAKKEPSLAERMAKAHSRNYMRERRRQLVCQ